MYLTRESGETFIQVAVYGINAEVNGIYLQTSGDNATSGEITEGIGQMGLNAVPSNVQLFNFSEGEIVQNCDVKVNINTHYSEVKLSNELAVIGDGRVFQKVIAD